MHLKKKQWNNTTKAEYVHIYGQSLGHGYMATSRTF